VPAAPPTRDAPPPFWRRRRVVVADSSMTPTLAPGDRLLVDAGAYRRAEPRVGDVVVLEDPVDAHRWLVKRVTAVDPARATVEVRGDAGAIARDSRAFGPVPFRLLRGRVDRIDGPAARARRL
jgi:hypothetical protein